MNAKRTSQKKSASGSDLNRWVVIYRIAWGLFIALLVFAITLVFLPKSQSLRHYHERRLELEDENRRLESAIQELAEKRRRFESDPAFIELTARETGMIKTNEHTFRPANSRSQWDD